MILDVGIGGGTISGTIADTQVAFGTAADTIGGSGDLTWTAGGAAGYPAALVITTGGSAFGNLAIANNAASSTFPVSSSGLAVLQSTSDPHWAANAFLVDVVADTDAAFSRAASVVYQIQTSSTATVTGMSVNVGTELAATMANVVGFRAGFDAEFTGLGASVRADFIAENGGTEGHLFDAYRPQINAGTLGLLMPFSAGYPVGAGAVTTYIAFWAQDTHAGDAAAITNAYSFWSDEQGVYRIKADNSFDSVYQAIPALYNPQFTKYIPGAANYERMVEYWTGNVATFGTEAGGTGTFRSLNLVGSVVEANGVPITTHTTAFVPSLMLMGG